MKRSMWLVCALLLGLVASPALAQTRDRDPLTDAEVDQMREAADFPNKRLELMIRFAKERIAMIGMLRSDPPSATRPKQIHDYLQDFISLLDETDDNIDMYAFPPLRHAQGTQAADRSRQRMAAASFAS